MKKYAPWTSAVRAPPLSKKKDGGELRYGHKKRENCLENQAYFKGPHEKRNHQKGLATRGLFEAGKL